MAHGSSSQHVGSFVAVCELSSCGAQASLSRGLWDLSSPARDPTCIPCIGKQTLNCWTTSEVPYIAILNQNPVRSFLELHFNPPCLLASIFSDEKLVLIQVVVLLYVICHFFSDCFQEFFFIFVLSNLAMICLGMVFFIFTLLKICWPWIFKFISFPTFRAISIISANIFLLPLSHLHLDVVLLVPESLFIFFPHLFSLCLIGSFLLLSLSFITSTVLLTLFSEFFTSNIIVFQF